MNIAAVIKSLPYLMGGLKITVYLSVASLVLGTVLGFVLGILAATGGRRVKAAIAAFVITVRGIPLLVQIFFIYFALPFLGIRVPAVVAAIFSFSIYAGALITEIVRGAIVSVPRGQYEAAKAIGMRRRAIVRQVIMPQAIRYTLPPLASTFAMIIKGTALASLLGIGELMRSSREIMARTLASFELMATVLIIYFIIIYPLARLSTALEKRFEYVH